MLESNALIRHLRQPATTSLSMFFSVEWLIIACCGWKNIQYDAILD